MKCSKVSICLFFLQLTILTNSISTAEDQFSLSPECKKIAYLLESQLRNMFFMDGRNIPSNQKETEVYCTESKNALRTIKKLRNQKCFNQFLKTMLNILYPQMSRVIKDVCGSKQKETLETVICMGDQDINSLKSCLNLISKQTKHISTNEKNDKELFPSVCCVYRKGQECLNTLIRDKCPNSNLNPRAFWNRIVNSIMSNIEQLACSRYDLTFCTQEKYFERLSKIKDEGNPKEFLVMPLMRIAWHFTEEDIEPQRQP